LIGTRDREHRQQQEQQAGEPKRIGERLQPTVVKDDDQDGDEADHPARPVSWPRERTESLYSRPRERSMRWIIAGPAVERHDQRQQHRVRVRGQAADGHGARRPHDDDPPSTVYAVAVGGSPLNPRSTAT
jgi:hypothetical protein